MSELDTMITTDPLVWAHVKRLYLRDGIIFSLEGLKYLIDILACKKKTVNCKKGSQMCLTTAFFIDSIHACKYRRYDQNIMYMMPTVTAVERLSKVSFDPIFQYNPWIMNKGDTNTTMCREINGRSIVMVGAQPKKVGGSGTKDTDNLRSIPCDDIKRDEIDLMDMDMVYMSTQRILRSKFGRISNFGSPTFPGYGIDKLYEDCVIPETKILTTDLRWKPAGELELGEKLIGFDETRLPSNKTRRYRETEVTNCDRAELPCVVVTIDDGQPITCTLQHKFLVDRDGCNIIWVVAKKLKLGDRLLSIGTWEEEKTQESGWVAGIYDGEGSVCRSKVDKRRQRGRASNISFAQKEGIILSKVESALTKRGFIFGESKKPDDSYGLWLKGGLPELLRFLGTFRPVRLLQKAPILWEDHSVGNDAGNTKKPKVIGLEYVGFREVVTLGTKHKTFIANGLLSHNSDQGKWQIKCKSCGKHTCLGETFPDCIIQVQSSWIRSCIHCHKEIFVTDGHWQTDFADRREAGFWVSGLLSPLANLDDYMYDYNHLEGARMSEFMRSRLGIATTEAENQLDETTILSRCTSNQNQMISTGETAMGVDIGKKIHVVVGIRTAREAYDILHVSQLNNLNELHDLALKMNVHSCIIDSGPHDFGVLDFQRTEPYTIYLCQYSEQMPGKPKFNSKEGIVKCNRNEWCDKVHTTFSENRIKIPRPSIAVNQFAREMTKTAKTTIENPDTGVRKTRWIKLGADHYFHSMLYFLLAASRTSPRQRNQTRINRPTHSINMWN